MVNLENQGMMTELDAVHGISTSELKSLFFLKIKVRFLCLKFS